MFAAMVVTWSVGSTSSAVVALLAWAAIAAFTRCRGQLRWPRIAMLLAAGGCATAFYLLPHPANPHNPSLLREAFGSKRWEEGWPTRVAIWKTTWHMVEGRPLTGAGVGNFTLEFVRQSPPSVLADPGLRVYAGSYTNDAHNEYLHVWSEGGVVALALLAAALVSFFVAVARRLARTQDDGERLAMIAVGAGTTVFLLDALMTFPLRLPAHAASLMFFLAAPAALGGAVGRGAAMPRGLRTGATALLLVATLCALAWQTRRVAAEHALKKARTEIETTLMAQDGVAVPVWKAAEAAFATASHALAGGDRARADQYFTMTRQMLDSPETSATAALLERAVATDPGYSNATSRLGALMLMAGNYARAREVLQLTLHQLEAFEVHERLGFASCFLGDKAAARAHWNTCRERRPQNALYYDGLIRALEP
jgi:hypothetical protein